MFIKTISNSKSDTFRSCMLKYKRKYIERIPEQDGPQKYPMNFGSYIHKILELAVERKKDTFEDLMEIAKEVKGNYSFGTQYKGKTEICIRNFLSFNKNLTETVSTEFKYEVPLKDDITSNGVIDRVIRGTDNGLLVIDYKTSKREKTKFDLYQDRQLKGYVHAISKLYNVPVGNITVAHYYPVTGNFVTVKYTSFQINEWVKSTVNDVWRIRKLKKDEFRANRNEFCNWCPYKTLCPEFESQDTINKRLDEIKNSSNDKQ